MKLRRMIRGAVIASPLPEILLRRRARNHIAVLCYHRVMPRPGPDFVFNEGVFSSTPEEFGRELRFLKKNMDVISMGELVSGLRDPARLPPRPAVITFDDGYFDNHRYALPLLKEAGLPACFFICTGLVGTADIPWYEAWVCCLKRSRTRQLPSPFGKDDPPYDLTEPHLAASIRRFRGHMRAVPWSQLADCMARVRAATCVDPRDYLEEPLFMSIDAVREMAAAGMDIGGHTRRHPVLACVDDAKALRAEIGGCFEDIRTMVGRDPVAFAYPWGDTAAMSDAADVEIKSAGFQASFSFMHGFASTGPRETWRLPRIHAGYGDDFGMFRVRMATAPR